MNTEIKSLADAEAMLRATADEANRIIADGQPLTIDLLGKFASLEKEYATYSANEVFDELKRTETPMISAIKRYSYPVLKHKEKRDKDTKRVEKIEIIEREKQIDLLKFSKRADIDTTWQFTFGAVCQSFCLWAANELDAQSAKEICSTYHLQKEAQSLADGKTPTSNNQLCKKLQACVDAILPPDADGNPQYKVNNHDVNYIKINFARKGKEALSVAIAKDGIFRNIVMDVMHRVILDKKYSIEYKRIKEATEKVVTVNTTEQQAA